MRTASILVLLLAAPLALASAPAASAQDGELREYAERTWASLASMTDPGSGVPAGVLAADGSRSVETSTTNIGAYLWSAVAARRLRLIPRRELVARLSRTLATLEAMERYADTGQYFNWYDHRTGAKLEAWPPRPEDEFIRSCRPSTTAGSPWA